MRLTLALLLWGLQSFAANSSAQQQTGRVMHVIDGDTLEVLLDHRRVRLGLAGIYAPRAGGPDGLRARQSLVAVCGGELAEVSRVVREKDGRIRAKVVCNGTDAAAEQVRLGMASVFETDPSARSLLALQQQAQTARRGLWSRAQ